jgi:hypothetical protein
MLLARHGTVGNLRGETYIFHESGLMILDQYNISISGLGFEQHCGRV